MFCVINASITSGQKLSLNELDCKISGNSIRKITEVLEYDIDFYKSFMDVPPDSEITVSIYGNDAAFKTTQKDDFHIYQ